MATDEEGFTVLDGEGDARDGARNVILFAQAMLSHARSVLMPHNDQPTCVRVGVHTGSVVSGLIGSKLPKFSLFGDTMNTSSRMESTSRPGCIQISESTYTMLDEDQRSLFEATGGVEVKGKGLMPTYIYQPTEEDLHMLALSVGEEATEYSEPPLNMSYVFEPTLSSFQDWRPNHGPHKNSSTNVSLANLATQGQGQGDGGASGWSSMKRSLLKNQPSSSSNANLSSDHPSGAAVTASAESSKYLRTGSLQHHPSSSGGGTTTVVSTEAKVKPRSALLPTVSEAGEKASDGTTGIVIDSFRPSRVSQSMFAKKSYESQVEEKEDQAVTRPSQTRPARRKPVRRNTVGLLSAAFSNLQQPLP